MRRVLINLITAVVTAVICWRIYVSQPFYRVVSDIILWAGISIGVILLVVSVTLIVGIATDKQDEEFHTIGFIPKPPSSN